MTGNSSVTSSQSVQSTEGPGVAVGVRVPGVAVGEGDAVRDAVGEGDGVAVGEGDGDDDGVGVRSAT